MVSELILNQLNLSLKRRQLVRLTYKCGQTERYFYGFLKQLDEEFALLQNNRSLRTLYVELGSVISLEVISEREFNAKSPPTKSEKEPVDVWLKVKDESKV